MVCLHAVGHNSNGSSASATWQWVTCNYIANVGSAQSQQVHKHDSHKHPDAPSYSLVRTGAVQQNICITQADVSCLCDSSWPPLSIILPQQFNSQVQHATLVTQVAPCHDEAPRPWLLYSIAKQLGIPWHWCGPGDVGLLTTRQLVLEKPGHSG